MRQLSLKHRKTIVDLLYHCDDHTAFADHKAAAGLLPSGDDSPGPGPSGDHHSAGDSSGGGREGASKRAGASSNSGAGGPPARPPDAGAGFSSGLGGSGSGNDPQGGPSSSLASRAQAPGDGCETLGLLWCRYALEHLHAQQEEHAGDSVDSIYSLGPFAHDAKGVFVQPINEVFNPPPRSDGAGELDFQADASVQQLAEVPGGFLHDDLDRGNECASHGEIATVFWFTIQKRDAKAAVLPALAPKANESVNLGCNLRSISEAKLPFGRRSLYDLCSGVRVGCRFVSRLSPIWIRGGPAGHSSTANAKPGTHWQTSA